MYVVFSMYCDILSECSDGSVRLYNNQIASTDDGTLTITGILEVCVDNKWATVCDDDTNFDNDAALQRACEAMGYAGENYILFFLK